VTATTATPAVTIAPTPAPSDPPEFPEYVHADFTPPNVEAGIYRTPAWFSIPFSFETNQPFGGIGEEEKKGEAFGLVKGNWDDGAVMFFTADPEYSTEETISLLLDTPGFEISPGQSVEVIGVKGTQLDLVGGGRVPAIATLTGHPVVTYSNNWYVCCNMHVRYIVLDVNGRVLLIEISAAKDKFDAFLADTDDLLGTVELLNR
jgi:hypothetical protein